MSKAYCCKLAQKGNVYRKFELIIMDYNYVYQLPEVTATESILQSTNLFVQRTLSAILYQLGNVIIVATENNFLTILMH